MKNVKWESLEYYIIIKNKHLKGYYEITPNNYL